MEANRKGLAASIDGESENILIRKYIEMQLLVKIEEI